MPIVATIAALPDGSRALEDATVGPACPFGHPAKVAKVLLFAAYPLGGIAVSVPLCETGRSVRRNQRSHLCAA
jgi:hypothetical protein